MNIFQRVKRLESLIRFVAGGNGNGSSSWGGITGTLSTQSDLQAVLNGKVDENSPITGDTKTKVTYDTKGLVISGTDLTESDIPTLTQSKITGLTSDLASKVVSVSGTTNRISVSGTTNPVVDISGNYVGQSSITTLGTIGTGTWNGSVVAGQFGGTGVANTGKTINLGGNFITSGAFALTMALTGTTNITLPTTGTIPTLDGIEVFTNKTLTTPTIASFTNAAHNHTNAAGGGQLTDAALSSAVGATKGGTGQTTVTTGDVLYGSASNTWGKLAAGTSGFALKSNGAGVAPSYQRDWNIILKTADQTRNDGNLANDNTLTFAMAANTKYVIRIHVFFDAPTAPDFMYALTGPSGGTVRIFRYAVPAGGGSMGTAGEVAYTAPFQATSTTATNGHLHWDMYVNNVNAGTFAVQWAQNTLSAPNPVTVLAGSYIEYMAFT